MKFSPYSYSKLSTHKQCNRRFKYQYIDKLKQGEFDKTALMKGGAVHSILENFPKPGTHVKSAENQHIADKFINSRLGEKYLSADSTREFKFGLCKDLKSTSYYDKTAMFRGSIDYVSRDGDDLQLVDWKTGRYKDVEWQDFNQLMFYAVYFFQSYSMVNTIRISYVYVEHDCENDIILERKFLNKYTQTLLNMIKSVETDDTFEKTESKLCEWCGFKRFCINNSNEETL